MGNRDRNRTNKTRSQRFNRVIKREDRQYKRSITTRPEKQHGAIAYVTNLLGGWLWRSSAKA